MKAHSADSKPLAPLPDDNLNRPLKIVRPATDQSISHIGIVGNVNTILLSSKDTNGRYCLIDIHVLRGGGPPPHRHDFEESFTVLEGEIEATFRGEKVVVRTGETLSIPANAPHSFTNASNQPARVLCICAPAGQEEFFAEVGVPVATRTTLPPKLDKAAEAALIKKAEELSPKYRTEFLKP
ncbi:MAG: cupin domain-containing protein [Akkermansiaceae bacterium]|nr:cupin domain-containing protein [Verrucomicrobiales bacterium]